MPLNSTGSLPEAKEGSRVEREERKRREEKRREEKRRDEKR